jgi:AcrR family transcriptional regulator
VPTTEIVPAAAENRHANANAAPVLGSKARRSAATKARLLDATIDCLVELGWSGTSTTEIVRRAGVSRGAQVHHYPTKEDLVLAAMEHLLMRRTEEFRDVFSKLPPAKRSHAMALDLLWETYCGDATEAWFELAVASRSDSALHQRFVETWARFWNEALDTFRSLFPEAADDSLASVGLRLAVAVLDGLTLQRISGAPLDELMNTLDAFKFITSPFFAPDQGDS